VSLLISIKNHYSRLRLQWKVCAAEKAVLHEARKKKLGSSDCETKTQYESFELIIGFHVRLKGINLCFEFTTCQLKMFIKF
jgi:hypothetical protein